MKTYLVTGAAGFIGANYIKYILKKHNDISIVVLDLLTYAGYLGTIAEDIDNERCTFIKGNICDRETREPLTGATVQVAGTSQGAVADIDGNYQLTRNQYIGYTKFTRCRTSCLDYR